MNKCLIVTYGYFGDIAFASSVAKKLVQEKQFEEVDYLIGFPQMKTVLENNPYISNVYVSDHPNPKAYSNSINYGEYQKVIELSQLSFEIAPPKEFQLRSGVLNADTEYQIYTTPEYDRIAAGIVEDLRSNGKKVLAIMANWEPKTYCFTREQYILGIDVPSYGYGGRHRNVNHIITELKKYFNLIEVGYPNHVSQINTSVVEDNDMKSLLFECSIMKHCDAFVGTEGGLCNLAAGVGTRTVITGDFVHQLYGWNGVLKKIKEPKLGPIHYFAEGNHIELDPFLSDEEVISEIKKI